MVDELTQESFQTGKAIVTVSVDLITAIADACKRSEQQNPGMSEEQKETLLGKVVDKVMSNYKENFVSLLAMIDASETREEDEDFQNAIDLMFKDIEFGNDEEGIEADPDSFAVRQYHKYKLAAGKTVKSILVSCGARLAPFDIKEKVCEYKSNHGNNVFGDAYNIDESIAIINTIQSRDSEESKKDKFVEAIKKCPYNDEIYYKILDMGLMTPEIYNYAKRYSFLRTDLEKNIEQKIIKKCKTRLTDIDFIKTYLGFISDYAKRQRFLSEIYALPIGKVKEKYGELKEYSSGKSILGFLKCNLGISKEENFVLMGEEQVSQKLKEYINLIIDRKLWYILIEHDFVNINQITGINSTDYDYVNDYFFDIINGNLIEYLRVMKDNDQDIQQKREIINGKLAESQKKLEGINEQIASLRFFDRKLKKELSEKKLLRLKFRSNVRMSCKNLISNGYRKLRRWCNDGRSRQL